MWLWIYKYLFLIIRKSFLPVVAGQDEYGTYDADGYYFDDVGYYDENGYFDDEGYYEVDDMGFKRYIDNYGYNKKKSHNRGDYADKKYSQNFIDVPEEKPKRHNSRQHKKESGLKQQHDKKSHDDSKIERYCIFSYFY